MKTISAIAMTVVLLMVTPNIGAQDISGSGTKSARPVERNLFGQPKNATGKVAWPQLFPKKATFDATERPDRSASQSGWSGLNLFKGQKATPNDGMSFYEDTRPTYTMPKWWQRSDPTEPSMFQNFNSNAAEFWGKTSTGVSNWASETNARMKARTFETWDTITRGFSRKPLGQTAPSNAPPLRSARNRSDEPRVRF